MSKIGWTDETWNPLTGCTPVSAGCTNCYAAELTATRLKDNPRYKGLAQINSRGQGVFNGQMRFHEDVLLKPLSWRKPRMVFVNSMSDLLHPDVPFEFIDKVFAVMVLCPQHTFQILTKRPERMVEFFAWGDNTRRKPVIAEMGARIKIAYPNRWRDIFDEAYKQGTVPPKNIWLGTSCENQETADERIPHLLKCPAAVRFLSCEPLIGGIDLSEIPHEYKPLPPNSIMHPYTQILESGQISWAIIGGESGKNKRTMELSWLTGIADQCRVAGVPVFVKQDSHRMPGQRGRIPNEYWKLKQYPKSMK